MNKTSSTTAGFTLIEVMVVLLIIGVSIGFISLNVGPRRQVVESKEFLNCGVSYLF